MAMEASRDESICGVASEHIVFGPKMISSHVEVIEREGKHWHIIKVKVTARKLKDKEALPAGGAESLGMSSRKVIS